MVNIASVLANIAVNSWLNRIGNTLMKFVLMTESKPS